MARETRHTPFLELLPLLNAMQHDMESDTIKMRDLWFSTLLNSCFNPNNIARPSRATMCSPRLLQGLLPITFQSASTTEVGNSGKTSSDC